MTTWFDQGSAGVDDRRRIRYMFQHFHAGDHIVAAGLAGSHGFSRNQFIPDLHAAFQAMQVGNLQCLFRQVNSRDVSALARHGLGKDATTATDVENGLASQRGNAVDPFQAQWIDFMQRAEFGRRIPPTMSEVTEFLEF